MKRNKIYKLVFVPAILLSLQSCFVAKDYERPEVLPEQSLYRTDNIPTDSTSLGNVPWQEIFTDPILQNHIATGLENNLDIRIALQNIRAAKAYVKQGEAGYLPVLGVNAGYSVSNPSDYSQAGNLVDGTISQYDLTASLSWEADIWGRIRSQKRAFDAAYLQTVAAHKAVKTEIIASIASIYYQLLALDEQVKIAEESIEARKSSLETTSALKEAGLVTAVAVKQTEAQIYTSEIILVNLQNSIKLLENTLSILMAEPPHAITRGELDDQEIVDLLKTGVPALLLENRPDVLAAEYNLINAFELTNVARANFYPQFSITAAGGFQSLELENWLSASSIFSNIAGNLFQPLLNGRKIRTAYEVALSEKEQALLNYKRTLLIAGREVSDALANYEAATKIIDLSAQQYEAYRVATNFSEQLLNNGLANYLEVLTARQNALNARLNIVDSRYQQLDAVITLYQALGGGWR